MSRIKSKISGVMRLWIGLVGALIVSISTPTVAQPDPRWGILKDLVEKDFAIVRGGRGAPVTVRWEKPDQSITFGFWSDTPQVIRYELEPETGHLLFTYPGRKPSRVFLQPDGQINLLAAPDGIFFGTPRHLWWDERRNAYRLSPAPGIAMDLTKIESSREAQAKIDSLVAAGSVRAAGGQALATVVVDTTATTPAPFLPSSTTPLIGANALAVGPRLALVIGNSAYAASMGQLPNPANDAGAMAQALGALGFQVTLVKNADQKAMRRAISDFGQRLAKAGPGSTGLFFYAGHGIQAKGINYLIPTDANIQTQADVEMEAVGADAVLEQMEEARASTNIVILDACRNMPLVRGFRSPTRGLAPMDAPNGSFIAYSTAPGSVAADGLGANSPFVSALVRNLSRKGESIEAIFRDVRREVLTATEGTQTPWDSSSLIQPFYFAGK